MEDLATISSPEDSSAHMTPYNAFERICLEVVEIEAIVNAASAAIDDCAPPSDAQLSFNRAQSLIGVGAKRAADALVLVQQLKAAVRTYIGGLR